MTKRTMTASIVGAAAAAAIGVWAVPSMMERDAVVTTAPVEVATPSTETAPARRMPTRRLIVKETERTTIAPDVVATLPATQPDLQARIQPLLNRGTKMDMAAEGFRDAHQFATVAHAARNTGVPFVVLKHRVLEQDQTLASAIRGSKPDVDAEREATRASNAARFDIAVITG